MKEKYDRFVRAYSDNFVPLKISDDEIKEVTGFVKTLVRRKVSEENHKKDRRNESKRFTNGLLGEQALEKLLGMKIIDWSAGDSASYNIPDLPEYNIGVKTVEYGKFPVIFKDNRYPQIICIRGNSFGNRKVIFVCGIATPDVLNRYQDDNLILDEKLRKRGTKTAFYGFSELLPLSSIEDLKKFRKKN